MSAAADVVAFWREAGPKKSERQRAGVGLVTRR